MKICLYEYNVTPNKKERDELIIKIENDTILYNGNKIQNPDILNQISYLLDYYEDMILNLKNIEHSNYKGGRQKQLQIYSPNICEDTIYFTGNTNNNEISSFYEKFKQNLLDLITGI